MPNSNVELLTKVAKRLGPLLREVVFVGGCTTALLITDEAAAEVRPTFDVDVIAEITTYPGYAAFSERLRALGFREDSSKGAPLCRWLIDPIKLDVMPLEEKILGFTNRWYRAAMEAAQEIALEPELRIRVVTALGVPRRGHCPPRSRSLSLHIRRWRVRCDSTARESTRSRRALAYLNHAYDERDPWLLNVQVDPAMDSMRSLPGFRDLVRRIGLPFH